MSSTEATAMRKKFLKQHKEETLRGSGLKRELIFFWLIADSKLINEYSIHDSINQYSIQETED